MSSLNSQASPVIARWREETVEDNRAMPLMAERLRRCLPWLAAGLLLLGALVGMFSWLSPPPRAHLVPGWMTDFHSHRWPALAAAQRDHELLAAGNFFSGHDLLNPANGQKSSLQHQLESLCHFPADESVVIYISAYAGINDEGEVFCLPSDANPELESGRYPLREILQSVKACPSESKLLVLDISWPTPDPRLGMVNSLVLTQTRALLDEIKDPGRMVLTSAADGQMALYSEELGQSVFGYYLVQGLRGLADKWNPELKQDGRITARELAAFVQSHVSRWARDNRQTEQVPLLLGEAKDFDLVAISDFSKAKWPAAPAALEYPKWLAKNWQTLDQWASSGKRARHPRVYQQYEIILKRVEMQWRMGIRTETLETKLVDYVQRIESRLTQQQKLIPTPQMHSLALLKATGVQPDQAAATELKTLFLSLAAKTANQPADKAATIREQLISKFQDATEKTPAAPFAMVLWDYLSERSSPSKDEVQLLSRLADAKLPEPIYAEMLQLRRLAVLAAADAMDDWQDSTVHEFVTATNATQQATVRALTFPWVQGLLDQAWQQEHDAEVLLYSRGYATWDDASKQIQTANTAMQFVLAYQDTITEAQDAINGACLLLPDYFGKRMQGQQTAVNWMAAIQLASDLSAELQPPSNSMTFDEAAREKDIIKIRRQLNSLVDLYNPTKPYDVSQLIAQCEQANAGPNVFLQVQEMLDSPELNAEQRVSLWEAGHKLSLRLLTQTMQQDELDPPVSHRPESVADAIIPSQFSAAVNDELLSLYESLQLLRVGGLTCEKLGPALEQGENLFNASQVNLGTPSKDSITATAKLASQVRDLWFNCLPNEIEKSKEPAKQLRLARILPPYAVCSQLDSMNPNPYLQYRINCHQKRWAWLAERYEYAAKDILGPQFYAESARDYAAVAGPLPNVAFLQLTETGTPSNLSLENPKAVCDVSWQLKGEISGQENPSESTSSVSCYVPSDLLQATAPASLPESAPLLVDLALSPGVQQSDLAQMKGFILKVSAAGRSYHLAVGLPSLGESQALDLLISTTKEAPQKSLQLLELRPYQGTHSFYLFARNLSPEAQDATLELISGQEVLASAEVKLGVNQTLPVTLAGKPPAANTPLPEVKLPLTLRAVSQTDGKVLAERIVPCDILSPREYLRVTNVVFDPSSPSENSLNVGVEALSLEDGPPLAVKLEAPSDQIPGLMGIGGGAFVGNLPSAGSTLTLQAKNMQFTPSARRPGRFYVDVDDYPRAFVFRTMFPRQGDPITPIEDTAPRIRLLAPAMGIAGPGFPVTLPSDSAPTGATLDVSIGRMQGRVFQPEITQKLPTARHQRIGLAPHGPKGELLLEASMKDWAVTLDATGIVGQRQLRARMLDVDGNELLSVQQTILLDDTPPEQVSFVSPPSKGATQEAIELRAMGMDGISGIADVVFFVGKPADGKLPEGAATVQADPLDPGYTMWSARLPLPKETGRTEISVQFTNGVGLSSFATISIEVLDPAALDVGAIEGTVVEGPRPQANLDVELLNAQGKPAKMAKTTANGTFTFEKVAAGDYTISVVKPSSQRKGEAAVKVQPGSTSKANISLAL